MHQGLAHAAHALSLQTLARYWYRRAVLHVSVRSVAGDLTPDRQRGPQKSSKTKMPQPKPNLSPHVLSACTCTCTCTHLAPLYHGPCIPHSVFHGSVFHGKSLASSCAHLVRVLVSYFIEAGAGVLCAASQARGFGAMGHEAKATGFVPRDEGRARVTGFVPLRLCLCHGPLGLLWLARVH